MRNAILELIQEAINMGASALKCCELIKLSYRTYLRWNKLDNTDANQDRRRAGLRTYVVPHNKLSQAEYDAVLSCLNSDEFKNLPPSQIVPILFDKHYKFIASESTMHRILRNEKQNAHRRSEKPPAAKSKPIPLVATQSNQVWTWDITYLPSNVSGKYFYLYCYIDIFDRASPGWQVFESESSENAALLLKDIYETNGICPEQLTIHSDNGSPMKGQTMQAMLVALGVANSHSRPRVSNDNALSESLFKTLKHRPQLPLKPFETVQEAREWVYSFMQWYHHEHRHSGINFVTPGERRAGKDAELLRKRDEVLTEYFCKHPGRFAKGKIRSFSRITQVTLNPDSKLDNTKIIA